VAFTIPSGHGDGDVIAVHADHQCGGQVHGKRQADASTACADVCNVQRVWTSIRVEPAMPSQHVLHKGFGCGSRHKDARPNLEHAAEKATLPEQVLNGLMGRGPLNKCTESCPLLLRGGPIKIGIQVNGVGANRMCHQPAGHEQRLVYLSRREMLLNPVEQIAG